VIRKKQGALACHLNQIQRSSHHGAMWVFADGIDGPLDIVSADGLMEEAVYAIVSAVLPAQSVDGVLSVPGRGPLAGGSPCYWLTGTVGEDVRDFSEPRRRFRRASSIYWALVTAGDMQFVARLHARHHRARVQPGSRITVECSFRVPDGWEWEMDDLPEEWCSTWRVLDTREAPLTHYPALWGYLLDLELATAAEDEDLQELVK
jgi:hypothetical protein